MPDTLNLIIAGKNNIAVSVCQYIKLHYPNINLYGICNKTDSGQDSFQRSFKKYCENNGVIITRLSAVYNLKNAIFLSLEFDQIIKPNCFVTDRLFNIHFSLLPKYKGMYTSILPLLNGENKSGVTLHCIDEGIDTGKLIAQSTFMLDNIQNSSQLYAEYISKGTTLVINSLEPLFENNFTAVKQPASESSYYSKNSVTYNNLELELNKTAWEIQNTIRAFSFRNYQLLKINGVDISWSKILPTKSSKKAGSILEENNNFFKISTIDYDIKIFIDQLCELLMFCTSGDLFGCTSILESNPTLLNEKNGKGWSPIIVAAYNGHSDIIDHLLNLGADINDQNFNGTSVLMYAKDNAFKIGNVSFVKYLLSLGADSEHRDYSGKNITEYLEANNPLSAELITIFEKEK
ncbi:MAG: formyltransferase family protein [Alteromonadaceae bacterium]